MGSSAVRFSDSLNPVSLQSSNYSDQCTGYVESKLIEIALHTHVAAHSVGTVVVIPCFDPSLTCILVKMPHLPVTRTSCGTFSWSIEEVECDYEIRSGRRYPRRVWVSIRLCRPREMSWAVAARVRTHVGYFTLVKICRSPELPDTFRKVTSRQAPDCRSFSRVVQCQ